MNNSHNSVFMHAGSENRPQFVSGGASYVVFFGVFSVNLCNKFAGCNDAAVNEHN